MTINGEKKYDPTIDYFGPQGSKLNKYIPDFPPVLNRASGNVKALVKDGFNYAAFKHDLAYDGEREKGFFGFFRNLLNRRKADKAFLKNMLTTIDNYSDFLSPNEIEGSKQYAFTAYYAVRAAGWTFYRTGKKEEE